MGTDELAQLIVEALYLALLVSGPVLAVAVIVGAVMGVLSAATQVQEPSLTFVPKLLAVVAVLAATGAWMAGRLVGFTEQLWTAIPALV